jgi:cytochrome oxidase Cu insertion factor (SCO1/SenC/PrrC family)
MMLRGLATAAIVLLLALDLILPGTSLGRRGNEAAVRAEAEGAVARIGQPLPVLSLTDLDGAPLRLADLRGHRVLITFERSVDW